MVGRTYTLSVTVAALALFASCDEQATQPLHEPMEWSEAIVLATTPAEAVEQLAEYTPSRPLLAANDEVAVAVWQNKEELVIQRLARDGSTLDPDPLVLRHPGALAEYSIASSSRGFLVVRATKDGLVGAVLERDGTFARTLNLAGDWRPSVTAVGGEEGFAILVQQWTDGNAATEPKLLTLDHNGALGASISLGPRRYRVPNGHPIAAHGEHYYLVLDYDLGYEALKVSPSAGDIVDVAQVPFDDVALALHVTNVGDAVQLSLSMFDGFTQRSSLHCMPIARGGELVEGMAHTADLPFSPRRVVSDDARLYAIGEGPADLNEPRAPGTRAAVIAVDAATGEFQAYTALPESADTPLDLVPMPGGGVLITWGEYERHYPNSPGNPHDEIHAALWAGEEVATNLGMISETRTETLIRDDRYPIAYDLDSSETGYLLAWQRPAAEPTRYEIVFRLLNTGAQPIATPGLITVSDRITGPLVSYSGGQYLIVWFENGEAHGTRVSHAGEILDEALRIAEATPPYAVTSTEDGWLVRTSRDRAAHMKTSGSVSFVDHYFPEQRRDRIGGAMVVLNAGVTLDQPTPDYCYATVTVTVSNEAADGGLPLPEEGLVLASWGDLCDRNPDVPDARIYGFGERALIIWRGTSTGAAWLDSSGSIEAVDESASLQFPQQPSSSMAEATQSSTLAFEEPQGVFARRLHHQTWAFSEPTRVSQVGREPSVHRAHGVDLFTYIAGDRIAAKRTALPGTERIANARAGGSRPFQYKRQAD